MNRCVYTTIMAVFCLLFMAGTLSFVFLKNAAAKGVKTSYKRYSIFKVNDDDILCEPYIVNQDDWLYKIFRKKGEISEKDFPYFLKIFKQINPEISNIDAIEPGIQILIPLKKVHKNDYDQSSPGTIDVPVLEFSTMGDDPDLAAFFNTHTVKKGDNVSSLIDKSFLEESGAISEEGLKAFQLANPYIQNINIVYEGRDIYLPDPSIKSQPWFQSLLSKPEPDPQDASDAAADTRAKQNKIDAFQLAQLKKYSSLIGGTLLSHGKIYFPEQGRENQVLDLSTLPVIETKDGSKILILSGQNVNEQLLKTAQTYWKDLKVQLLAQTLDQINPETASSPPAQHSPASENRKIIETILFQTGHDYVPNAKIPFMLNNIQLEASFGRIIRKDRKDLLINFGNVYGAALEVLKQKEFEIILIAPDLNPLELAQILLDQLGYTTRLNPAVFTGDIVETIYGLYAVLDQDKLFIPMASLTETAQAYLKKEKFRVLSVNPPAPAMSP